MKKYELIDKDGHVAYTGLSLSELHQLADANSYMIIYTDGDQECVAVSGCCGPMYKVYTVVPVEEAAEDKTPASSSRFDAICAELSDLYSRKNQDYGNSFHKTFEEYGVTMAAIRLEDKLNRFKRLIKNEAAVEDESIVDTLKDLANYAIMTLMELPKNASKHHEVFQKDTTVRYNILGAIDGKIICERLSIDKIRYIADCGGWTIEYVNGEPRNIFLDWGLGKTLMYTVEVSS